MSEIITARPSTAKIYLFAALISIIAAMGIALANAWPYLSIPCFNGLGTAIRGELGRSPPQAWSKEPNPVIPSTEECQRSKIQVYINSIYLGLGIGGLLFASLASAIRAFYKKIQHIVKS